MHMRKVGDLAAAGSNTTGAKASIEVPADADALAFELEITAVGTTMTWKYQGSNDDPGVSDANSDWFDLSVFPSDSETAAATFTKTAVGVYESQIDLKRRPIRKVRLNVTTDTGCTYGAELFSGVDV